MIRFRRRCCQRSRIILTRYWHSVNRRVVPCLYRGTMLGGRDYPFSADREDPLSANRMIIRTYVRVRVLARGDISRIRVSV